VNTLWLSPITTAPADDFGYAVTDHFALRADFGTASELRSLIQEAHARDMRVILDFVPNHLSDQHPYYIDAAERMRSSAYFDFFVRSASGEAENYFEWRNLKNLNYDHPEVQNFVIEAFAYWVREFGIDGFRVDAAWGPRERAPEFWPRWRTALKRIKPDLLLLAEAPVRDPYYLRNGFDAAYDWTEKLGEWAWRDAFDDPVHTADRLRAAIKGSGNGLTLRFLENNDTGARFVTRYGIELTRVAAALLLTLPGIPSLYTGQEIGAAFEPYEEERPITWDDSYGLRPWYRYLIGLRQEHAALRGPDIRFLEIDSSQVLAYVRGDRITVLLNFGPDRQQVRIGTATFELEPYDVRIFSS
jgi:cyclomaltodextrinase / maltogenic alpha-amylase / neopullulanase